MPTFIVTANYTGGAIKGMVANPSDREKAARDLTAKAGGKLLAFYLTTGATDFLMVVEADDVKDLLAGLMVAASAGAVSNVQTQRAFSAAEFMDMQKRAGQMAGAYAAPG